MHLRFFGKKNPSTRYPLSTVIPTKDFQAILELLRRKTQTLHWFMGVAVALLRVAAQLKKEEVIALMSPDGHLREIVIDK